MSLFFSADYVLTVSGPAIKNGIIEVQENGEIIAVYDKPAENINQHQIRHYNGVIVPGFVNAHCHLELSHMLGKIPKHTGLVNFIKSITSERQSDPASILKAMEEADQQMIKNGIVAVGDHANSTISYEIKKNSSIYYHTFLELIGFEPDRAKSVIDSALNLQKDLRSLPSTLTPHAPYSVSKEIFRTLRNVSVDTDILSIHNQESEEENKFFRYKTGEFLNLYKWMGKDLAFFKAQSRSSLQTFVPLIPKGRITQLVHNTFTSAKDVSFIKRIGNTIFWCLCPSANLYIENQLPRLINLLNDNNQLTIGTDSLASNDILCILSEMKILSQFFPEISFETLLKWGTLNGASFLGISNKYGSIEPGKSPGLNLLKNMNGLSLTKTTEVEKLI